MGLTIVGMLAFQYVGVHYVWGGNDPMTGLDCSGLVIRVLKDAGIMPQNTRDMTAQGIYRYLLDEKRSLKSKLAADSIVFYGGSTENITHIGIAINKKWMIHAANGGSTVRCLEDAVKRDARVQMREINYRSDMVACLAVDY